MIKVVPDHIDDENILDHIDDTDIPDDKDIPGQIGVGGEDVSQLHGDAPSAGTRLNNNKNIFI